MGVIAIILIIAAFLARGVYVIGQGSDAELQARSASTGSTVMGSGWMLLDSLRSMQLPALSGLESRLGIDSEPGDKVVRHNRCGTTHVVKRGSGWYCYKCEQQTTAVTFLEE